MLFALIWVNVAPGRAAMSTATVQQTKRVGTYKLVLMIGPLEQMCTAAQAKQMPAKCAEVMVSGSMVMGGMGMSGPMPNHHLELHVYNRTTGKTIAGAMVSITVRTASGKLVMRVPIAVMYGLKEGKADLHYGNNVALKAGQYHVVAQVEMTTATFDVKLGGASMPGM
jgi:5-hydroxyisourate hydrolase-like protein (transthyretin family)